MCVTTCIGRATFFGDISDANSLISKYMKANKTVELAGVKEFVSAKAIFDKKFKLKNAEWEKFIEEAQKNYPGKTPIFGNSYTKPRVFYII
jgi:Fe-S-cluster-containing dehydrogenase component